MTVLGQAASKPQGQITPVFIITTSNTLLHFRIFTIDIFVHYLRKLHY